MEPWGRGRWGGGEGESGGCEEGGGFERGVVRGWFSVWGGRRGRGGSDNVWWRWGVVGWEEEGGKGVGVAELRGMDGESSDMRGDSGEVDQEAFELARDGSGGESAVHEGVADCAEEGAGLGEIEEVLWRRDC